MVNVGRKIHNFKNGFTLIEILMAITILSVIGVVAIPNLRKFGDDQNLISSFLDLRNGLRQSQSSGVSGVKCSVKNKPFSRWVLTLNPTELTSVGKNGYKITSFCKALTDQNEISEVRSISEFQNGVIISGTTCQNNKTSNIDIKFSGIETEVDCNDALPVTYPFTVTLNNPGAGSDTKTLKINKVGVIAE